MVFDLLFDDLLCLGVCRVLFLVFDCFKISVCVCFGFIETVVAFGF